MGYQHRYTRVSLEARLAAAVGKTLGEVDSANVFDKAKNKPKITGIAGDVIEQSVIGYPANPGQEPDLVVDGTEYELKTTGLRKSKRLEGMEAKEPMSITAVSLDNIAGEEFETSNFWHKAMRLLIVYYLYDSDSKVVAAEYAGFPIKGYQFHEFDEDEKETLRNDWQIVHDFIAGIQERYPDEEDRKREYPRLSSALRSELMLIDTAPKYPHPPRFRLKRTTVTTIARKNFGDGMEQLGDSYTSYAELDRRCHEITAEYTGMTVNEIAAKFDISVINPKTGKERKGIADPLICAMFGSEKRKMNSIELFAKIGLIGKSIVLDRNGLRTEDMKLFKIDFDQFNEEIAYEESQFYDYFIGRQLLCMVFEEPSREAPLADNVFQGFKRVSFGDDFIENDVRRLWEAIRDLIVNDKLIDVISYKDGKPVINKTGVVKSAPNFPKRRGESVFVRGSGSDSTRKPVLLNGIRMYAQYVWLPGASVAAEVNKASWL